MPAANPTTLRIDRFLWFIRLYKTRTLAAKAVSGGHVRINGERARAGAKVSVGDEIELIKNRLTYRFEVQSLPTRRGPAVEAQRCYVEDQQTIDAREEKVASLRQDRMQMPRTDGRPDKHTRRKLRERSRGGG